jgi:hypothetical protein
MFKNILLAAVLLVSTTAASAEVAKFTWNPVVDDRVAVYVLSWGNATGVYDKGSVEVAAPTVTALTADLGAGTRFFAVKACNADKSLCSDWSNEVKVVFKGPIVPPAGMKLDSLTFTIK